jgi:predicted nucleotidyltransferase
MTSAIAESQNRLHRDLSRFINGCTLSRRAKIAGMASPALTYRHYARGLARRFQQLKTQLRQAPSHATASIDVPPYAGDEPFVRRMMAGLAPLRYALAGAYLHGSLADGEAIAYSDFDGLVILRNAVVSEPGALAAAGLALNGLRRIMFAFDPLQHHGWFVLTEADLGYYCDEYFPAEIFGHCRSLLAREPARITLAPRDSKAERRATLARAVANIRRRSAPGQRPADMLSLKSMLSEIMLLPALYLQVRYGQAVYKKFSFERARHDFSASDWSAMDEVSELRRRWHYEAGPLRRFALTATVRGRKPAARWFAPTIPPDIASRLTPQFWTDVARLAGLIESAAQPAGPPGE